MVLQNSDHVLYTSLVCIWYKPYIWCVCWCSHCTQVTDEMVVQMYSESILPQVYTKTMLWSAANVVCTCAHHHLCVAYTWAYSVLSDGDYNFSWLWWLSQLIIRVWTQMYTPRETTVWKLSTTWMQYIQISITTCLKIYSV